MKSTKKPRPICSTHSRAPDERKPISTLTAEEETAMNIAHIDRQTKTTDGVTFTNTHSGQKKAYGDSYYEYDVTSDLPAEDVERVCSEHVYPAIPHSEWQADYRTPGCSMEKAFRPHYSFRSLGGGEFRYVVTCLYTD